MSFFSKKISPEVLRRPLIWLVIFGIYWLLLTVGIRVALGGAALGADYYVYWTAGHAFFFEGKNPYSAEIAARNQINITGHLVQEGDQLWFAYPPQAIWGLLPLIGLPFEWSQAAWMALNLLALFSTAFFLMPRSPVWMKYTVPLFYPLAFGVILGNFAVMLGLVIWWFYGLIIEQGRRERGIQVLLGIALAWCWIKPQFIWLAAIGCLLAAVKYRLIPFFISFAATLGAFLLANTLLMPGWWGDWLGAVQYYVGYQHAEPLVKQVFLAWLSEPGAALLTWIFLALGGVWTILCGWRWLRGHFDTLLLWIWIGLFTALVHPRAASYDQIVLLLSFCWWAAQAGRLVRWLPVVWGIILPGHWVVVLLSAAGMLPHLAVELIPIGLAAGWWGWLLIEARRARGVHERP